jgi:hypothetical protein
MRSSSDFSGFIHEVRSLKAVSVMALDIYGCIFLAAAVSKLRPDSRGSFAWMENAFFMHGTTAYAIGVDTTTTKLASHQRHSNSSATHHYSNGNGILPLFPSLPRDFANWARK